MSPLQSTPSAKLVRTPVSDLPRYYLDYAATTPLDPRVLEATTPYLTGFQANPNSLHTSGREAFNALEEARHGVCESLGAHDPSEVIFTSGGTESDNASITGIMAARKSGKPAHVIVSAIEHHAVLEPARRLSAMGHKVTYLKPGRDGLITPEMLASACTPDTALVSIMYANNEMGAVQNIHDLAAVAHEHGALFHTDAVQALGKCPMGLEELGVDAASFSIHKIYGPKGVGILYLRRGTPFVTQMPGGGQESGLRSGTQNVAGAKAAAAALVLAENGRDAENARLRSLQTRLVEGLLATSSRVRLVVDPREHPDHYLPNIIDITVDGCESETMILRLDSKGFEVAAASACSAGSLEPSHVLVALGIPRDTAFGSLRISLGRQTTEQTIDAFLDAFPSAIR